MPKVTKSVIKKSALVPTALIAGGANFIGYALAETLLEKGTLVILADKIPAQIPQKLSTLLQNKSFALFDVDLNLGMPEEIQSVDYVFQLASTHQHNEVTLDTLLTNALSTKLLLDFTLKAGAKFMLASSINVYQGLMASIDLTNYFGNTPNEEQTYSMTEAQRYAEALVWEYFKKTSLDVRIVRLPIVIGTGVDMVNAGNLGRLMNCLIQNTDLVVYGDGTEKEHYLYLTDAINGMLKATFNEKTSGKIFSLITSEYYATLETAFLLKSLANKSVKIVFEPKSDKNDLFKPRIPDTTTLKYLKWEAKVTFREAVIKTLESAGYETNEHNFKPAKLIENKLKERENNTITMLTPKLTTKESVFSITGDRIQPTKHTWVPPAEPTTKNTFKISMLFGKKTLVGVTLVFAFFIIFVGTPTVRGLYYSRNAVHKLETIPEMITQLKTAEASTAASEAYADFIKAQASLDSLSWLFKLTGKQEQYFAYGKALNSAAYFTKAIYNASKASNPFATAWDIIRPDSTQVLNEEDFDKLKLNLGTAKKNLQLAQAEFGQINRDVFPEDIKNKSNEYIDVLKQAEELVDLGLIASQDIPEILAISEPKKYMVLFQNSNEIRPTGGFIGSYGILEIDKGKIKNFVIDDIYNPDGQIDVRNINVLPPRPIEDFLKEKKLHIRNANWDPNFATSASQIQSLYSKIDGEKTDGVIAIDLYFAKNLLEVTGPIFLTAYNEEITADNLYEKAQFYSEFNYKNGSDQKRSFLTLFGSKLIERLFSLPRDKMDDLVVQIHKSLNEKHLLISLPNNNIARILKDKAWDGNLRTTYDDYLAVINANLGGNKANHYVQNHMAYNVMSLTRDGLLRAELTLTYKHTGEGTAWPGGAYTNYVRVITQTGTKLTDARVQIGNKEETIITDKIITDKINGYTSYETSFVLPPKETAVIKVKYDLPTNLAIHNLKKDYALLWQKQPGTNNDEITFSFDPPFGLSVGNTPTNYADVLNEDKEFKFVLK